MHASKVKVVQDWETASGGGFCVTSSHRAQRKGKTEQEQQQEKAKVSYNTAFTHTLPK